MQAAGNFHKRETRPNVPSRNHNTWMGDPMRALQARKMIQLIKEHDLVAHTASTGTLLTNELKGVFASPAASGNVFNFRGERSGTFLSLELERPATRDEFLSRMRRQGLQIGGYGERRVRLR